MPLGRTFWKDMGEEEIMVILCSQRLVFYKGDSKHLPNGNVEGWEEKIDKSDMICACRLSCTAPRNRLYVWK